MQVNLKILVINSHCTYCTVPHEIVTDIVKTYFMCLVFRGKNVMIREAALVHTATEFPHQIPYFHKTDEYNHF